MSDHLQSSPHEGHAAYGVPAPDRRPGTVTAAAITTIVMSTIVAIAVAITLIGFAVARDQVVAEIEDTPGMESVDTGSLVSVISVVLVVVLVWALAAVVLAVLAMRRSSVARVLLVVSSVVTALVSLVAILSLVSAVTLIASIAVVVMLFTGGAGDWYAGRPGRSAPPPTALG